MSIKTGFPSLMVSISIVLILGIIISVPSSHAKVGYDINVKVGDNNSSSTWSRSQSTAILSFELEGDSSGDGTYYKRARVSGFAGQGLAENTNTKPGRLVYQNSIKAMSDLNWIHIEQKASNDSIERYDVFINESLPTVMYNEDELFYRGEYIRSRNSYISDFDVIRTNFEANRLLKSARFGSVYSDSLIYANVTSRQTDEVVLTNRTTAFTLSSDSDIYSGLDYMSGSDDRIEQGYHGSFTINQKIVNKYGFNVTSNDDDWLKFMLSEFGMNDTWSAFDEDCMS